MHHRGRLPVQMTDDKECFAGDDAVLDSGNSLSRPSTPSPSKLPRSWHVTTDASHFLDLEAAVDSEEETVMDEDEATQDFIDDEDTGNIDPATPKAFHDDSLYHTHEDLLNEAELIRTRYGRAPIPEPDSPAEDRSLEDVLRKGKLWRVQVKKGFEEASVAFIYRKIERKGHFGIEYCLWITEFPGALYLVAPNPQIIQRVFERVHTVYVNRGITLVPQEDCDVLCRMLRDEDVPFKAGDWVRVKKKGLYKDDVGCVLNADLPNSTITMLLRPRLSYVNGQQFTRPLPALFDPDRARVVFGPGSVQGDDATQCFSFQGMSFQHGFLKCSFPLRQLVTKDVLPKFSEIENFYSHLMTMTPPWDWSRCKWYRDDYFNSLRTGDRIRVEQGEGMGQVGYLVGVKEYGVVEVRLTAEINADLSQDLELELLAHQTVRAFKAGDYIMIRHGVHAGIRGHVAEVGKTTLKVIALRSDNLGLCPDMDQTALSTPFHLEIWNFMASFAQEDHLLVNHKVLGQGAQHLQTLVETPLTNDSEARKNVEKESEPGQMVSGRDPMVGREILITKGPLVDIYRPRLDGSYAKGRRGYTGSSYCGYVGTIRSSSEGLNVYNVHIGSIGTIVQVHRDIVLDRFTRLPLSVPTPTAVTPSPAVSSTPTWDSNHMYSDTPAWNPSSRTPLSIQSSTPLGDVVPATPPVSQPPGAQHPFYLSSSGIPVDWLMMESLQGKLVPVRLLSDQQVKRRRKFTIYAGSLARTLGTPISGDPPVIDIKPVWPAITAFSVPICELIPEPPWEDLHATIIAGALRGSEVTILNKTSDVWGVRVDHGDVVHVKPAFLVAARLPI